MNLKFLNAENYGWGDDGDDDDNVDDEQIANQDKSP